MSRRTRRVPGVPRDASTPETSGAMSAEMFMSCAGEFAACDESRARRMARQRLLWELPKGRIGARVQKIAFRGARVFTNRATSAELAPTGRASTAPRIFLTARTAFESKSPAGEIFLQPFEFENLKGGFHPFSDQNLPPARSLFHP